MQTLWQSNCERHHIVSADDPFPCLTHCWGSDRDCPMNSVNLDEMKELANRMYKVNFPYGAWVVRLDLLKAFPVCELVFFREEPTEASLREKYGSRFLRFSHFNPHEKGQGGQA